MKKGLKIPCGLVLWSTLTTNITFPTPPGACDHCCEAAVKQNNSLCTKQHYDHLWLCKYHCETLQPLASSLLKRGPCRGGERRVGPHPSTDKEILYCRRNVERGGGGALVRGRESPLAGFLVFQRH
jgi:hypothetical protein